MNLLRKDRYRTDPSIALDVAHRVEEKIWEHGLANVPANRFPPDSPFAPQAISYDLYLEDGDIRRCEFVEQDVASCVGTVPSDARRVTIYFGGGPGIRLDIEFGTAIVDSWYGGHVTSMKRKFGSMMNQLDWVPHYFISRDELEKWFFEFVTDDPFRILNAEDIRFVAGENGIELLKSYIIDYVHSLPEVGSPEADDENPLEPDKGYAFEPHFFKVKCHIGRRLAVKVCEDIAGPGSPLSRVSPREGETKLRYDDFAIGHPASWEDGEHYDGSGLRNK